MTNMDMSSYSSGSLSSMAKSRITRELSQLALDPIPGTTCYCPTDNLTYLHATITGPPDTPFASGIFLLSIHIPNGYPYDPPRIQFQTPIHHPNVDSEGRICVDWLKQRTVGSWSPAASILNLLHSIRALLEYPKTGDGLVPDTTAQFENDYTGWCHQAKLLTEKEATFEKNLAREESIKESLLLAENSLFADCGPKPVPRSTRILGRRRDKENQWGLNTGYINDGFIGEEETMTCDTVLGGKRKGYDESESVESIEKRLKLR